MTPELTKALNDLAITIVSIITTAFIPWAFSLFRSWAKAKVEAIADKNARDALVFALTRLDETAATVVDELNQTVKQLSADGKLSKEDSAKLLRVAYNRTTARLTEDTTATLQNAYGERLQAVLVGKIESKVATAKAVKCAT